MSTAVADNAGGMERAGVVLTAAGALAALTLSHPKARLWMWQGLLLVLLLLPAIEPWNSPPVQAEPSALSAVNVIGTSPVIPPSRFQWRPEDWLWVIAAGAALRLMWVAAGFLRLRRYRMQAQPLAEPPLPFTSDAARWYASDSVPGPVTYGWRRPVILLPARVLELPADLREAIECHELIHVRRGDWLLVSGGSAGAQPAVVPSGHLVGAEPDSARPGAGGGSRGGGSASESRKIPGCAGRSGRLSASTGSCARAFVFEKAASGRASGRSDEGDRYVPFQNDGRSGGRGCIRVFRCVDCRMRGDMDVSVREPGADCAG